LNFTWFPVKFWRVRHTFFAVGCYAELTCHSRIKLGLAPGELGRCDDAIMVGIEFRDLAGILEGERQNGFQAVSARTNCDCAQPGIVGLGMIIQCE